MVLFFPIAACGGQNDVENGVDNGGDTVRLKRKEVRSR